jgi:hypothetical protein
MSIVFVSGTQRLAVVDFWQTTAAAICPDKMRKAPVLIREGDT